MGEILWWVMNIILPAVLLIGLIWLVLQRKSNKTTGETEAGTRAEYADEERHRREGTDDL